MEAREGERRFRIPAQTERERMREGSVNEDGHWDCHLTNTQTAAATVAATATTAAAKRERDIRTSERMDTD